MSTATRTAGIASTITYTLTASDGTAITPAAPPTLTVYADPNRTTVAVPTATMSGTATANAFTGLVPAALPAGTYYLTFSTVLTAGQGPYVDADDQLVLVTASGSVSSGLCTLAQAKAALNIPATSTKDDVELQGWIDAATPVVENITGPIAARSVTESHDGGGGVIVLRQLPASAVVSVVEYVGNIAYPLAVVSTPDQTSTYSVTFDSAQGTLTRRYGAGSTGLFADGTDNVVVTYTAGYGAVPANVVQAAIEFVRHNFGSTQNAGPSYDNAVDDAYESVGGSGYSIPNRVRELLQGSERLPGIA